MVSEKSAGAARALPAKEFRTRRIQLRKAVFDAPAAPRMGSQKIDWENVQVTVGRDVHPSGPDLFDLVLTVEVLAENDGVTIFRAIVEEVGLFYVLGYSEEEAVALIGTKGAEQLYPYAREFILSMVSRCGLQNLGLKPFSFTLPI